MCFPIQKYKFQYKNKSFGTEKYLLKHLEKIGWYFIYDYYYVPKYMLIIVYLNKPYVFHYYKLSQLYNTKHHLKTLYHTIHPYTSPIRQCTTPCTSIPHDIPLYITIHPSTSPHIYVWHHTPLYITIHPCQHSCIIPCTSIHHHIPLFITIHLYKSPYTNV